MTLKKNMTVARFFPWAVLAALIALAGIYRLQDLRPYGVSFDRTAHDFGAVIPGAHLSTTFIISNLSTTPLRVADIVASCGCIASGVSRRLLECGQSENLVVSLDTSGYATPADLAKTIAVSLIQDGKQRIERIAVSAQLRPPFKLLPVKILLEPGASDKEMIGQFSLIREGLDVSSFRDLTIEWSSPGVQSQMREISDERVDVQVRAVRDHLPMQAEISYRSPQGQRSLVVPIETPLQNQVRAVPSCLVLTNGHAENREGSSSASSGSVRLVSKDEAAIVVIKACFDDASPRIPVIVQVDAESSQQITVSMEGDNLIQYPAEALLRVSFCLGGDADGGEIVVPVYIVPDDAGSDLGADRDAERGLARR